MRAALAIAGVFALLPLSAYASPAFLIGTPTCSGHGSATNVDAAGSDLCMRAAMEMHQRGATVEKPPGAGCRSVAYASGPVYRPSCDVFICNERDESRSIGDGITVGVMGVAAQAIHAYCRINGQVGGQVKVYTPEGQSVAVHLGSKPKDEVKREAATVEVRGWLRGRITQSESQAQPRQVGGAGGDDHPPEVDGDFGQDRGIEEGQKLTSTEVNVIDLSLLLNGFMDNFRRVRQEPNPNWQNTASFRAEHKVDGKTITLYMGFLAAEGKTVRDIDPDDKSMRNTFEDIVNRIVSQWRNRGLNGVYSAHLWRMGGPKVKKRQAPNKHDVLGEMVMFAAAGVMPLVVPPPSTPFRIYVRRVAGETYIIECTPNDPVGNIKEKIYERTGVPVDAQRLIFNGKQLEDGRTLTDYNIQTEGVVHLVERLRGGRDLVHGIGSS